MVVYVLDLISANVRTILQEQGVKNQCVILFVKMEQLVLQETFVSAVSTQVEQDAKQSLYNLNYYEDFSFLKPQYNTILSKSHNTNTASKYHEIFYNKFNNFNTNTHFEIYIRRLCLSVIC